MSYDAILQVNKAEEAAHICLLEAQSKAKERIAAAQSAATAHLKAAHEQASVSTAAALAAEREKNQEDTAAQSKLSAQDCDRLREQALPHLDAAVSRVMERVMGEWHL